MILRVSRMLVLACITAIAATTVASAAPITSITDLNHFRDTRSVNDVGIPQGDALQYGAQVIPNDAAGTRMFAIQGAVRVPAVGTSACGALIANPNLCVRSTPFDPALTGAWQLTFVNGADQATATTPVLAPSAVTQAPFADTVTISGFGATPTISWSVPAQGNFSTDAIRILVYNKNLRTSLNTADVIFSTNVAGNARSFQIPAAANLQPDVPYVFSLQLIETRDHSASTGGPNSNIARRSSSFFDFRLPPSGAPPEIVLPTVTPAPSPGVGPTYNFTVRSIQPGEAIFIDPAVAIGYKYAIGAGDPNFASVVLPAVGNNIFTLNYLHGGVPILQQILANAQFFFPSGGVSAFDVTGIEASAMLDPNDVTAFITGLTFAGAGDFTGTMVPLITDVPLEPIPEPATLLLFATTAAGFGFVARRRRPPAA
jgi:hypothetical protein